MSCGEVLTRLSLVAEEPDTFGKINRLAGLANSPKSIRLNPELKAEKTPFTSGVEADTSTQPACPEIPLPNNSGARTAI